MKIEACCRSQIPADKRHFPVSARFGPVLAIISKPDAQIHGRFRQSDPRGAKRCAARKQVRDKTMAGTSSRFDNPAGNLFEGFKTTAHRWFPVSPAVLQRVQERVYSKHYHHNPLDLITDVRSDASLYLFCVRKTRRIIKASETAAEADTLLQSIGEIVSELNIKQAHHAADHSLPFQIERQREIVLSSAVVDLLGEKLELDRDAGFTCALIRQLGYALIAWNYPTIYRQALDEVAAQGTAGRTDLNTILHANLGFSPSMLGIRFAETWGYRPR